MENQGSSICFHRFLELRIASLRMKNAGFGVADLDCRMEKLKSNCRKPAMETRQQHIQVDLGNLMAFDPHHSFPSIPFSKLFFFTYTIYLYFLVIFLYTSGLFEMIAFEKLIENLLLEIGILFGLIPSVKWQSLSEIMHFSHYADGFLFSG
ncbi:hypothetical protein ACFXTO_047536 [Malus domestica]